MEGLETSDLRSRYRVTGARGGTAKGGGAA